MVERKRGCVLDEVEWRGDDVDEWSNEVGEQEREGVFRPATWREPRKSAAEAKRGPELLTSRAPVPDEVSTR